MFIALPKTFSFAPLGATCSLAKHCAPDGALLDVSYAGYKHLAPPERKRRASRTVLTRTGAKTSRRHDGSYSHRSENVAPA